METNFKLRLLTWNANGITPHKLELQASLNIHNIDIAMISESHLTPTKSIKILGYKVYQSNHPDSTAHAGSVILVKNNLSHSLLPFISETYLQATSVQVSVNKHFNLSFSSIYCPPGPKINSNNFKNYFESLGKHFIVAGDINAKHFSWGCHSTNPRGRVLYNSTNNSNIKILPPSNPTYWPTHQNRRPDILDIFIARIPSNCTTNISNTNDLSSDHSPIILDLEIPCSNSSTNPQNLGKIDWPTFQQLIETRTLLNHSLKSSEDIDSTIQKLTSDIQECIHLATTQITIYPNNLLPNHIKHLLREKRKARSRWQRHKYPIDKHTYNQLNNKLRKALQHHNSFTYQQFIQNLTTHNSCLWKTTKKILKTISTSSPLRKEDNSWVVSDTEKANLFGQHLSQTFTPHDITLNPTQSQIVTHSLESALPVSLPAKHTSPGEIEFIIKKLHNRKAPGFDRITNRIAKNLPKKVIILLSYIYNAMLRLSYFPLTWKFSEIIMIPKPHKPPEKVTSYRPISLLPTLSKVFEKILLKRLIPLAISAKIIPDTQFGFRPNHSTIHQLHRVVDTISVSLEKKHYCAAVFLDVAQAFDRVWFDGLLFKLKKFLPAPYFLLVKSYLSDRTFVVRQNSSHSNYFNILAGVPQGSDIAPFLYNIFTHDIPKTSFTELGSYADDTAIVASNENPNTVSNMLQRHLNIIDLWTKRWKIKINETKSSFITFTLKKGSCPVVTLNSIPIPSYSEVKYLGLILDSKLTWNPHLKAKRKALNTRLHLLRPLLKSKMNINIKLLIYKSLLRPLWTYGIQLWGAAKPSNTRTIQAFQSICLRLVASAPWYLTNNNLHKDLKIQNLNQISKLYYTRLHNKFQQHTNPLISKLSTNSLPGNPRRRLKRQWCRDLL